MSWFFFVLIGPFLYAVCNHIDKVLLEKYFKGGGVGTLMLFSSLLSALVLPLIFLIDPTVVKVDIISMLTLAVVSILYTAVLWFYFLALQDEEASVTIVFYQLVPVFGLILGYFILGEVLTKLQFIAMIVIILGTSIVSFEIDADNKFTLRKQTIKYMLAATICWALGSVIFKMVALEENVWRSLFWEHVVLTLLGVILFIFVGSYREKFLSVWRENSKAIISLNFANEVTYMTGTIIFSFAYMMAPISLILLANSYQAIFVFFIGIILTLFFPQISAERIEAKNLWQKAFAIAVTGVGTYLLLISS